MVLHITNVLATSMLLQQWEHMLDAWMAGVEVVGWSQIDPLLDCMRVMRTMSDEVEATVEATGNC